MTHRSEHDSWSKQVLLGEGSEAERAAHAAELEACDRCARDFLALRSAAHTAESLGVAFRAQAQNPSEAGNPSLDATNDPELLEMTQRFEAQAMTHVQREGGVVAPIRILPWLRPVLGIAAALVLGAVGLFFLAQEKTPPTPGGGELGGEILVQRPEPHSFVWNAAGCESFTVAIFDLSGKIVFEKRELRETRLRLDESMRAGMLPAQEYEIQIVGANPRPGQKNLNSKRLRFTLP